MPKVPTYDQFTVAPNESALPNVSAPDLPVVAGKSAEMLGQGMMRAGSAVDQFVEKVTQEADQLRVIEAATNASKAQIALKWNKDDGYINLKGEQAFKPDAEGVAPHDKYEQKLRTQLDSIGSQLSNDRQKTEFARVSAQIMRQFSSDFGQHAGAEYKDYQTGVWNGTIDLATQQMSLNFSDPKKLEEQKMIIEGALTKRDAGLSEQQQKDNTIKAMSPGNTAVVTAAIDAGQVAYAKEYLKQNAEYITPENRLRLAKMVEIGDFEERTQSFTDKIWTDSGGDLQKALKMARDQLSGKDEDRTIERLKTRYVESNEVSSKEAQGKTEQLLKDNKGDINKALNAARKNLDGSFEDAVVTRLKSIDAERVALRERGQRDAADSAWKIYSSTGSLAKIPPSTLAAMDGRDLHSLRTTARADANAAAEGTSVKTDWNVYYALQTMVGAAPNTFKQTDLRLFFDKLSPEHRKHFIDLQNKAKDPGAFDSVVTAEQQKSAMVKRFKMKDDDAGVFLDRANRALVAREMEKGKPLDAAERQIVLDGLVREGEVPGTIFGTNTKKAYQVKPGQNFKPTWTQQETNRAIKVLKDQGVVNPSQNQIDDVLNYVNGIQK